MQCFQGRRRYAYYNKGNDDFIIPNDSFRLDSVQVIQVIVDSPRGRSVELSLSQPMAEARILSYPSSKILYCEILSPSKRTVPLLTFASSKGEKHAEVTMAGTLHAAATFMQPTKVGRTQKCAPSRITCSLHTDFKDLALRCADAAKVAGFALATSALVVSGASAEGVPKRLTFDEIQSKTYMEVKGTGTANQCPIIDGGVDGFTFKSGKYTAKKFCLEPTSFTVKAEGVSKNAPPEFQKTKLMTRLTYTLDEIEGPFEVADDGSIKFEEKDGIDYAAVTVQLPGGERVPFLFTIKELVATGKSDGFSGDFLVPSYRGSSFLDPKGRGGSQGYDNAVALPAGGRGDEEELFKENIKNTSSSTGNITLSVTQSNPQNGEVVGVFESLQPSDTDMGAKAAKDVKIQGIWYAQLE